jgi:hypothetical protein
LLISSMSSVVLVALWIVSLGGINELGQTSEEVAEQGDVGEPDATRWGGSLDTERRVAGRQKIGFEKSLLKRFDHDVDTRDFLSGLRNVGARNQRAVRHSGSPASKENDDDECDEEQRTPEAPHCSIG